MADETNWDDLLSNTSKQEQFAKWFWTGKNGNNLIRMLNSSECNSSKDKICRESQRPHIYCVVLNDDKNPGKNDKNVLWRYCKVGQTEADTHTGTNNRMEQIIRALRQQEKPGSVILVLPKDAIDSRGTDLVESSIRSKIGYSVDTKLAKKLGFPLPTKWVLTTQKFLEKIIAEVKKCGDASTELFASSGTVQLKFNPDMAGDPPSGLAIRSNIVYEATKKEK